MTTVYRVITPDIAPEFFDTEPEAEARAAELARRFVGREVVWHQMEVEAE